MIMTSYGEDQRRALWDRLDADYPYFFSKQYAQVCQQCHGEELGLVFSSDQRIVIPVRIESRRGWLRVARLAHPPVCDGERLGAEAEAAFLQELAVFLRSGGIAHRIAATPQHAIYRACPEGALRVPAQVYYLELEQKSEQELFKNLRANFRNEIRSAIEYGAHVQYGSDQVPVFHELLVQTMERANAMAPPLSQVEATYHLSGEQKARCGVVYVDGIPVAGAFWLWSKYAVFYLWGGSASDTRIPGAAKLLHWDQIRSSLERGVRRYDFGGGVPANPGVGAFKRRFGSDEERGFLWKMDLDRLRCRLFDRMAALRGAVTGRRPALDRIDRDLAHAATNQSSSN